MTEQECTCPESTGGNWAFTTIVCENPDMFAPAMGESDTPDESAGYGWFTRDEIGKLDLHPGFRRAWKTVLDSRDSRTIKCVIRRVDITGQVMFERPADCPHEGFAGINAPGGGGPAKMPHDVNDIWQEQPGDYRAGRAAETSEGGGTGEHTDTFSGQKPRPDEDDDEPGVDQGDGVMPDHPGKSPPPKGPIPQGYMGGHWPQGGHGTGQPPASPVGGQNSVAPSVKGFLDRVTEPVAPGVYEQMAENFPPEALGWVHEAEWAGPLLISLNLIDWHDMRSWSAYSEHDRVRHFMKLIRARETFRPVILIKVPGHKKYRVVDGHHRALAFRELGRPVKAWVGRVPFGLVHAAEETHSSQENSGSSAGND